MGTVTVCLCNKTKDCDKKLQISEQDFRFLTVKSWLPCLCLLITDTSSLLVLEQSSWSCGRASKLGWLVKSMEFNIQRCTVRTVPSSIVSRELIRTLSRTFPSSTSCSPWVVCPIPSLQLLEPGSGLLEGLSMPLATALEIQRRGSEELLATLVF